MKNKKNEIAKFSILDEKKTEFTILDEVLTKNGQKIAVCIEVCRKAIVYQT